MKILEDTPNSPVWAHRENGAHIGHSPAILLPACP